MKKIPIPKTATKKEKQLLRRYNELTHSTDVLGPTALMTTQSHTNASRAIMAAHNFSHIVNIKNPDMPQVLTGFENTLGSFSSMLDQVDADYEIVAKFEKNKYNYVLIGFDKKHKRYHAWKRTELEEHSEGFSTRYKNGFIDSLEVGDTVKKGEFIKKSESFDKEMNYCYGKNLNTVYLISTKVYEDQILLMDSARTKLNTFRATTITLNIADNEILLNWYGDDRYQGIPMVGEKTRNGYLAIIRQIESAKAPYNLKKKKLQTIERGDRKIYGTGRVIDIDILYNKERAKLNESTSNKLIADMYDEQQAYYKKLYRYMQDIVDGASDGSYTYTDEFTIICEEAHDYVDASAFFADSNDNLFGNMQIVIHLMEEQPLMVGSKLVGRYGNKGVIGSILPPEESWHMEDGTPVDIVVATLGIIGRLNQSQMNEHSINELSATAVEAMKATDDYEKKGKIIYRLMKYLNSDEASEFKRYYRGLDPDEKVKFCKKVERDGIYIVQDPIENANMFDIAKAYEEFPPKFQKIVYGDGRKSMRKVLCAKMFFVRLKQDPVEKYSARSRGPVNPLTTLPAKSNRKKKNLDAYSDVPVRLGELEQEVLLTMCNHPAAVADFMTENSTSLEAKMAMSERNYLGDPDSFGLGALMTDPDIDFENLSHEEKQKILHQWIDEITAESPGVVNSSKKNMEQILAYLNVLGTDIDIEVSQAPDGEWYED